MTPSYVIWNAKPQMLDFGSFEIRYYSLLFALGFVTGYIILLRIFKRRGLPQELLDKLTVYMVVSTIIGARMGHCLFYEFDYYRHHLLEIFLPWRGKIGGDFEFTGFQGLASHGAGIGILAGILLFARKTKSSYLWTMDMIVMVTALAGCFIRLGNLMNSEIYGNPTGSNYGFVFTNDLKQLVVEKYQGTIQEISFKKIKGSKAGIEGVPVRMDIQFTRKVKDEARVEQFGALFLPDDLRRYNFDGNVLPPADSLPFSITKRNKNFVLSTTIIAVPRHPSQLYEAGSYLFIFLVLLLMYYKLDKKLREGLIFGTFLVLIFAARFFIEFLKENQEAFEDTMSLNMGQILSIPFVVGGLILVIMKWPRSESSASS